MVKFFEILSQLSKAKYRDVFSLGKLCWLKSMFIQSLLPEWYEIVRRLPDKEIEVHRPANGYRPVFGQRQKQALA